MGKKRNYNPDGSTESAQKRSKPSAPNPSLQEPFANQPSQRRPPPPQPRNHHHPNPRDHVRPPHAGSHEASKPPPPQPPKPSLLPTPLPPLPPISTSLSAAVFTHPSHLSGPPSSKLTLSYDRLEFLGDAYIELLASRLLYPRYPHLPPGRLSQLRELLVKNEMLAEIATGYGFDERVRMGKGWEERRKGERGGGREWVKVLGDVVEAYVAAVVLSEGDEPAGVKVAEKWLWALWEPVLGARGPEAGKVDWDAKVELAKKVLGKGVRLEYRDEGRVEKREEGKVWFGVGVWLLGWGWEGVRLGGGEGLSKGEAGMRAAEEAMGGVVTAQAEAVKRAFDERVKAEREDAVGKGEGGGR